MNMIRALKDSELLSATKALAQKERAVTMDVLRHLQEIERRKLFADLKYPSLFEYAVHELSYSEAAAGRRIQAMRLMTELPEVAPKIESGALNLTNICQAQSFFRDLKRAQPERAMSPAQKIEVLARLEDKSSREGLKVLLAISPVQVLPRERERIVSTEHTEVSFVINQELKNGLDEVRSLLGPKGATLNMVELVGEMARLSKERLLEKRFGRKQMASAPMRDHSGAGVAPPKRTRYIPKRTKYAVWQKAGGKCSGCGSIHQLNFDHVRPFALGGDSAPDNLQLLCSSCNLRRGIKSFGTRAMKRDAPKP